MMKLNIFSGRLLVLSLVSLSCLLGPAGDGAAAPSKEQLRGHLSKLKSNEDDIRYYQQKIKLKQQQLSKVTNSISQIEEDLEAAGQKLVMAQKRYDIAHNEVKHLSNELEVAQNTWDKKRDVLLADVRKLYKYKYLSSLKTFIEARSLPELTRRTRYFTIVQELERKELDEIKQNEKRIDRLRDKKMRQREEYGNQARELDEAKREFELKRREQQRIKQRLAHDKEFYERAERELERESRAITSRLQDLFVHQRQSNTFNIPLGTGRFIHPVIGPMTSPFGYRIHPIFGTRRMHTGQDFGVPAGTPIRAADSGVVIEAGWIGGYGKAIMIDHGRGIVTLYGHTSAFYVQAGQRVQKGQVIAAVGSTGNSTGPHLHLEVRINGSPVNPLAYF
ncbi:MAG TPA: peptidoglycan DD-metalloendopeptidase family protein [Candidatus Obscuribacterales bacterium]